MRYLGFLTGFVLFMTAAAAQEIPDPAPTTDVETLELANFEPTRDEAVLAAYVDGVVAAHRREFGAPGVTVSVVKDGKILFAKGYGTADVGTGAPVQGDATLFRIGSVSKTFVWTAVMMLAERGRVDLDTDVNQYLDGLEVPEKFGAPITLRQIMHHRGGFEDTLALFTHRDDDDTTLTEALENDMPKRVMPPNTQASYSNWATGLATKVVEDVTGQPFAAFMQAEMLNPLEMIATTMNTPATMTPAQKAALSAPHKMTAGAMAEGPSMQIGPYGAVGAIASTADDMAKWMLVHLGRGTYANARLMRPETHDAMWTRAYDDTAAGADLAHGFQTKIYRGVEMFGHGGATDSFYTNMMMAPELGLGVFVSQNTTENRDLVNTLADLVVDHVIGAPDYPVTARPGASAAPIDFAGAYMITRRSFSTFEKLFAIGNVLSVAPAPDAGETGAIVVTSPVDGEKRYDPVGGGAYQAIDGDRFVVVRNDDGKVMHLANGVHSFNPVGLSTNPALFNGALVASVLLAITTLLGAWRRQGRSISQKPLGGVISVFALGAAVGVFALVGLISLVTVGLADASASDLVDYPPPPLVIFRIIGFLMFLIGLVAFATIVPAWSASGWGVFRKIHHTAFALALTALSVMLVLWNVVFAPMIG